MKKIITMMLAAFVLASCEKLTFPDDVSSNENGEGNVTLRMSAYSVESFTRANGNALSDYATRLSVGIFTNDGTKVKVVTQTVSDAAFGDVSLSLAAGTYKLVVIAHNGQGNATLTSTEKVTFPSNKITDTLAYYGTLEVTDGEDINEDITLTRRVALLRLILEDEALPSGISRIKFYYTGGSSTYSPATGYGCVNSKQTEYRSCYDDDGNEVMVYDLYTLPHAETDELKLVITTLDESDNPMYEYTWENIPIQRNKITQWTGALFSGSGGSINDGGITIGINGTWDGTINYSF